MYYNNKKNNHFNFIFNMKINKPTLLTYFLIFFSASLSLFVSKPVLASAGHVQALQMPAWIVRDGIQTPLTPGINLKSGDRIKTGSQSRVLLSMEEGSLIKLGENAELYFESLIPPEEEQGFFEAVIKVVQGAFRFTTTAVGHSLNRQIDVRIGSVTAGIRGTDIWGSSKGTEDVLCLIEGNITAQRAGEPEFTMNQPLSVYIVPKNKPAIPVSPVSEKQLMDWAEETEIHSSKGVLSIGGRWAVNLMSFTSSKKAQPFLASLNTAGYAAEVQTAIVKGKTWYRLRVTGFKTRDDAKIFATNIKGTSGVSTFWIVKV